MCGKPSQESMLNQWEQTASGKKTKGMHPLKSTFHFYISILLPLLALWHRVDNRCWPGPSLTSLILSLREDLPSDKASHNLEPSFPEQSLVATLHSSGWKKVKWFAALCRLCPPKCITQTKGIYLDEMRNDLKLSFTSTKLHTCQVYKRLSIIFCQSFLSFGGWLYLYFLICGEANISAVPEEID